MDRLTSIIAFMRAADAGTFAGAASAIGVNGSAVSKSVGRLESHLGVRLFQRTTRALALTDDGRVYYERCARVLADLDEAEAAMSQRSQSLRGRLAIDLPVALGRLYVAPALTNFLRRHPELELVATLNNRFVDLVGEGYDAVVRIGDVSDSSLVGRRLVAVPAVVCASPAYLAEMGTPERPKDLARHRCITFVAGPSTRASPWRFAADSPDRRTVELTVGGRIRLNSAEAAIDAAVAGVGLVQVHAYLAASALATGRLCAVLQDHAPTDSAALWVLYPSSRHLSPKVRAFVDFITDLFTPTPIWERHPASPLTPSV
jgi:LysR family transcriptional regulator, regulator for bpeEF and oprC